MQIADCHPESAIRNLKCAIYNLQFAILLGLNCEAGPGIGTDLYLEWGVIDNSRFLFIEGLRWKEKCNLSYWDALILAAARNAKAKEVWSEDLAP